MDRQKHNITMLVVGFALVGLTYFVVKKYLILPDLSLGRILALPMSELVKVFETVAVIIFLAEFVLQELIDALKNILQKHEHSVTIGTRLKNLAYIFVVIFGSACLYIGVSYIAGW